MSLAQRCAVCGTYDKPTSLVRMGSYIELRCKDCLYFGTSGPPPADPDRKPRQGESLTAWLKRTGRSRPATA